MAPVIQGIADSLAQALCPLAELLVIGSIPGDILFFYTAGAHETPFVMIAAQPYLGDIIKLTILSDLSGIDMAVIVQDGSSLCILMIKLFGCFCLQKKVLVHKFFHC